MSLKLPRGRPQKYSEDQRLECIRIASTTAGLNAKELGAIVGVAPWKVLEWLTEHDKKQVKE